MFLDDPASDGKAQSGSFGFSREKGIEQAGKILGRYAGPGIFDGHTNLARLPFVVRRRGSA